MLPGMLHLEAHKWYSTITCLIAVEWYSTITCLIPVDKPRVTCSITVKYRKYRTFTSKIGKLYNKNIGIIGNIEHLPQI